MPAGIVFVWKLAVVTVVPFLFGMKTFGVKVGSFIFPGAGGVTAGSGTMSWAG